MYRGVMPSCVQHKRKLSAEQRGGKTLRERKKGFRQRGLEMIADGGEAAAGDALALSPGVLVRCQKSPQPVRSFEHGAVKVLGVSFPAYVGVVEAVSVLPGAPDAMYLQSLFVGFRCDFSPLADTVPVPDADEESAFVGKVAGFAISAGKFPDETGNAVLYILAVETIDNASRYIIIFHKYSFIKNGF